MLMRVNLSGGRSTEAATQSGEVRSEERVHTPASLLYQLRNKLSERGLLCDRPEDDPPKPGSFVEFEGSLKRNPIVEVLDSFAEMMDLAEAFDSSGPNSPQTTGPKGKKKGNAGKKESEYVEVKKQMQRLSESLKAGDSIDLTASDVSSQYSAVITLETRYLNDPTMSDLVDGNFRVLAKVVRSVASDDESISLLRKTAISKMPPRQLEEVFGALQALSTNQSFDLPEISWEVHGPAIQVIPIAIYA